MEIIVGFVVVALFLFVALLIWVIVDQAKKNNKQANEVFAMFVKQQPESAKAQAKAQRDVLDMLTMGIDKATTAVGEAIKTSMGTGSGGILEQGEAKQIVQDPYALDIADPLEDFLRHEEDPTAWATAPVPEETGFIRAPQVPDNA